MNFQGCLGLLDIMTINSVNAKDLFITYLIEKVKKEKIPGCEQHLRGWGNREHVGMIFPSFPLFSEFLKLPIISMRYTFGKHFGEI